MLFRWDPVKAQSNLRKHGVDFQEAATVLDDDLGTTFPDEDHSTAEVRLLTVGMSVRSRLLVVSHTDDGSSVRIISARAATNRERKFYEEA